MEPTQSARRRRLRFSALQRAEIAEIALRNNMVRSFYLSFSALQRAEIAEIRAADHSNLCFHTPRFSALQRAEIAEI